MVHATSRLLRRRMMQSNAGPLIHLLPPRGGRQDVAILRVNGQAAVALSHAANGVWGPQTPLDGGRGPPTPHRLPSAVTSGACEDYWRMAVAAESSTCG